MTCECQILTVADARQPDLRVSTRDRLAKARPTLEWLAHRLPRLFALRRSPRLYIDELPVHRLRDLGLHDGR